MAAERKRPNLVRLILQHKDPLGDPLAVYASFGLGTAFHFAAHNGCLETMRLLVDHPDVDVNDKNGRGNTALHLAVDANQVDVIRFLKTRPNLDVEATNQVGETPLMMAIASGRTLAAEALRVLN